MSLRSRLAARRKRKALEKQQQMTGQGPMNPNIPSYLQQPALAGSVTSQGGFFKKDPGEIASASLYSPWAMELMQKMAQQGYGGIENLMKQPFNFAPIAQQARTNFAQTTIPSIAERFSSLGTGGSQRSSAFPQLLSQAGSDLEQQLAAMQEQYGLQEKGLNAGTYGNLIGMGLKSPWENIYRQGSPAGYSQLINKIVEGLGHLGGSWIGNR